jgi:signal transduction histidine kinase
MNIGLSYSSLNEYDKALKNYFLGLDAWELLKEGKNESFASIMSEIGVVYQMTDSLDKAEKYLNEAVTYYEKSKSSYRVANTLLHLAIVNRKRNNMVVAQNYLDKSLKLIKESGAFSILPDYYLELSNIEESKGNLKKSFDYFKKQQVLKDSLSKEQNLNDMNRMQEMYAIEKQNAEKAVLKKEVELGEVKLMRNKIVTVGVIILLVVVVVFSFYLLRVINRWKAANEKLKEQQILINRTNETLQKQRDELEILANELKRLNSDKDRFMSILSHDLKSPFSTLLGLSEMLIENIRVFPVAELEDIAVNLSKTARNTYKLLEDILLWTRAQSGKIPFKPQKLNFSDICNNALEILNPVANAKGITLNYEKADKIYLFADNDMIRTVLRNLVSNAIKFTDKNGSINIMAEGTGAELIVSVSDNGVGISPENLPKLFNNSEIITTPGTANETGTGFGLLLCKEFVEKHDGRIWAESEPGSGSKFKFSLPVFTENINGNILL